MLQEIIDKYGLVETNIQIGQTFIYGVKVYRYKNSKILFAACDMFGEPLTDFVMVLSEDWKQFRRVSNELILDLPEPEIGTWFSTPS